MLIALVFASLFVTVELISNRQYPEFFVGVEFAYSGNVSDLKDLVDKMKNYTNLLVIGALEISFNQTALDEACDYIYGTGFHFIVLFTNSQMYSYNIFVWMEEAKQKYGTMFLGVYRYDEPGGNQLDHDSSMLVKNATNYADAAANYTGNFRSLIKYYLN